MFNDVQVTLSDDGEFECQVLPTSGLQTQLRASALVSVVGKY